MSRAELEELRALKVQQMSGREELEYLRSKKQPVQLASLDGQAIPQISQEPRALFSQPPATTQPTAETVAMGGGVIDLITGAPKETEATRTLPEIGALSTGEFGKDFRVAAGLLSAIEPKDQMDVIKSVIPEAKFEEDEKGNIIVDLGGGQRAILNKPGLSSQDALQLTAQVLAFFPAAKLASLGKTLLMKIGLGGAAAATTEAGIQEIAVATGAEEARDPTKIALAGGLGAGAEAVMPLAQAAKSLKEPIEKTLRSALDKGTVLTSDVFPPTTFVGKAFQKVTERIPVLGTGKMRAVQQKTREQVLDDIARDFDIDPSSAFEQDIISSANRVFKKSQARAAELRNEAVTELNKVGNITPNSAIKEINNQIENIKGLGARGDMELLKTLQNIKGELAGNFERLKDIRTTIFADISDITGARSAIKSGGDASLTKVAGALSKDLDDFAVTAGKGKGVSKELKKAANKWKASNRIFKDNFTKSRDTELKRALTKGKIQPEVINITIKGGKVSELTRLHRNLDLKGRASVQQQILKNMLEKADGNPTRFLNELNRPNNRKAMDVFFRGKSKAEIDGVKKFLDMTRRSQEAGASIASQQEVTAAGLITGAALAPAEVIGTAATLGILGRALESKPIRDMLIKLSKMKPMSKKAKELSSKIAPLIIGLSKEEKE